MRAGSTSPASARWRRAAPPTSSSPPTAASSSPPAPPTASAAAPDVTRQRVGHLVVNLEPVAVRIGEVDAALADVVGGVVDGHAVGDQAAVRLAQVGVAAHLEGDVEEADLVALGARRVRWVRGGEG